MGSKLMKEVLLVIGFLACGLFLSCSFIQSPSLEEQKAQILNRDIRIRVQTAQAFLDAWGEPAYQHFERTRFYPVKNGSLVPQFRVPIGEVPHEWEASVVSSNGYFMSYPERGELLGFIDDRLVYREHVSEADAESIGKSWQREAIFHTPMEKAIRSKE